MQCNNLALVLSVFAILALEMPAYAAAQPTFVSFSFSTTANQLNVNWITEYSGNTSVSVECKLNGVQNCSYTTPFQYPGAPRGGSCTIIYPNYTTTPDPSGLPRTVANQLACTAYNTSNPSINTTKSVSFYPRAIEVSVPASMNPTVGDTQNLLITVKNNGTLTDNYTVSVISTGPNPNLLVVTGGAQSTQSLDTNDVQQFYVGLTLLVSGKSTTANATVRSKSQPTIQFSMLVSVKGTDKSLPEFDAFGVLQIIAMAALFASFLF